MMTLFAFMLTNVISFSATKIQDFIMLLFLNILLFFIYNNYKQYKSKSIWVLSTLFSFFMIFGHSYRMINSWNFVVGNIQSVLYSLISFIGLFLFFSTALQILFELIRNTKFKEANEVSQNKFIRLFHKHPFLISIIIILLCWLPYIVAFYPAILTPDSSFQIKQFYHIPNKYSDYVVLLDPNVIITNHHPFIHTILLGICTKIGQFIGSFNIGLFFYSMIQVLLLSSVLAYTIAYMKKLKISLWIQILSLMIYAFVPAFPFYAMTALKDTIFTPLVILYIIVLYDIVRNKNEQKTSIKNMLGIALLMLLISLFRNNGIYVVLLSFPLLFFLKSNHKKQYLLILLLVIFSYIGYSNLLLPTLKITPGSIREVLSIPFQQTARYVSIYRDELSNEEVTTIDKALTISTLAQRYQPEVADPVKNGFNRYTTKAELGQYFNVWVQELFKHPNVYMEATMNNTYGYFYPVATRWYIHSKLERTITEDGFQYHYNHLSKLRKELTTIGKEFPSVPVVGLVSHIGTYTWLLLIMAGYLIHRKKYQHLIFLAPAFITLLVCVASPINTYFRYALPFIFGMPIMIGLFIDAKRRI